MLMKVCFEPIGYVKTEATEEEIRRSEKGVKGKIVVYDEFKPALQGIEGYSHIIVLAYLDRLRPFEVGALKVRPRRLTKYGLKEEELPEVGVFAVDSPTRPNPISLSIVKLISVNENLLEVENLDLFDGTPVLDIKPYSYERIILNFKVPNWLAELQRKTGTKII